MVGGPPHSGCGVAVSVGPGVTAVPEGAEERKGVEAAAEAGRAVGRSSEGPRERFQPQADKESRQNRRRAPAPELDARRRTIVDLP
jgi:hypothetical protein